MQGARSPYLGDDADVRALLKQAGYKYDTSIPEKYNSRSSPSAGKRLWPYTLERGIQQDDSCKYFGQINNCEKSERHPGLYEIPMWMYQIRKNIPASRNLMDPPNAYRTLKRELDRNYKANRAPVGIWTHSTSTNFLNKK